MRVLIACEESQRVCIAFRKKGHEAYSCDILPCSGGHPEWHIQGDVLEHLNDGWDMMIAHPPCTYLTVTGNSWFYNPNDKHLPMSERSPHPKFPNRRNDQKEAIEFFKKLYNSDIPKIAVENPVGVMSTLFKKPSQIIQPYYFGDSFSKKTCLWLKGLPLLTPTEIVSSGERITYKSGKRCAKWFADAAKYPPEERTKIRNKTFQGIADAMADQWG
jgi:hypothetical protein